MPTQTERTLGAAVCLAAIPFPYVGPIVGLALQGRSPYVRYHALRCLLEQVLATAVLAVLMAVSVSYSIHALVQSGVFENGIQWGKIDWLGILLKSVATWVLLALWNVWNVANSVRDAMGAYAGKPITARKWAERKAAALAGAGPVRAS